MGVFHWIRHNGRIYEILAWLDRRYNVENIINEKTFFYDDDSLRFLETPAQKKKPRTLRALSDKQPCTLAGARKRVYGILHHEPNWVELLQSGTSQNNTVGADTYFDGVTLRQMAQVTGLNPMNVQRA